MAVKELAKKEPQGLTGRAYALAERAHAGQKRKTGEPYFTHVLATAEILAQWHLDEATVAAGLLHDTVEDTSITSGDIRREFGEQIAFLVDGVTKLGHIKYRGTEAAAKLENLRKMIVALSQDLRVIFIKLADRLHNMRTLHALPPLKQKRIALETDEIYAPLAYRLGMQNLSGELRDLAFPYLYPQEDAWLKKTVREEYETRQQYLERLKPFIEKAFHDHGISPLAIDFRAKRLSSLYHKLLRHDMDTGKIYDLVAMRIIVRTAAECYAVLGAINNLWPPLPGRIKDYIAMPKPNGYRSLHTTVIGPDKKIVEFQIRTQEMHDEDENGIAAHWLYEQSRSGRAQKTSQKKAAEEVKWVQQLRNWQEKYLNSDVDPEEFLASLKIDFFKDRIFAITPKGEVIDLPAGATPIDFAYTIHTEIGNMCVGAKVNNRIVPLNYELRSGDLVEVLTQKNKKPSEDWLEFVKTAIARNHIRAALRKKKQVLRGEQGPLKSELRIAVKDRLGLLKDIATAITQSHVNIVHITTQNQPSGHFPIIKIQCEVTDKKKIEKLVLKLKKLREVREVSYRLI